MENENNLGASGVGSSLGGIEGFQVSSESLDRLAEVTAILEERSGCIGIRKHPKDDSK